MSVTVTALGPGRQSQESEGERSFSVMYSVVSTAVLDEAQVRLIDGLPKLGDVHPNDASAYVSGISVSEDGSGYDWSVEVSYTWRNSQPPLWTGTGEVGNESGSESESSDSFRGGGFPEGAASGWTSDDPCRLCWTFEMDYVTVMFERMKMKLLSDEGVIGAEDDCNVNTAFDSFDRPVQEAIDCPVYCLTKNVPDAFISPTYAASVQGSVNNVDVNCAGSIIKKYDGKMRACRIRRARWGALNTPFWELRIEIIHYASDDLDASFQVLQVGFNEWVGAAAIPIPNRVTPALLDDVGQKTDTPYYKRFAPSKLSSWAGLKLPRRV